MSYYLVDVKESTLVVEARVELVEHADDLHGRALSTDGSEANNVREEHGDIIKLPGLNLLPLPQLLSHLFGENRNKEIYRLLFLLFQGLVYTF